MTDGKPLTAAPVGRLLRPRTLAIVGAAPEPGSIGGNVVANLERSGYDGELHFVSRSRREINGRRCVPSIDELPLGLDAVVLVVPETAAVEAVSACVRRQAASALVFASGFAELGEEGRAAQDRLAAVARDGGLLLNGPNCIGFTNFVEGVALTFEPFADYGERVTSGVGIIAQSGAMTSNIRMALAARGVPVTCAISTGNEAVLGVEDFLADLIAGESTRTIALFVEQIRRPALFLDLVRQARTRRKPIVLLHPGRTQRARQSAQSHTGALAGDHAVASTILRHAGVALVDTLDELFDVTTLLARWPEPPAQGAAVMSNSGAYRGLAFDLGAEIGLDLPVLAEPTRAALAAMLPAYAAIENPLDITTVAIGQPDLPGHVAQTLLDDPGMGGLVFAFVPGSPSLQKARAKAVLPVILRSPKPVAFAIFGDDSMLDKEFTRAVRESGVPFFRSPDRALRAMARVAAYGQALSPRTAPAPAGAVPALPGRGTLPEYRAKAFLAAAGIAVPPGDLARDVAAAERIAERIGYPVALKAQAAALAHKSDAGGVLLNIADAGALRAAWVRLQVTLARARPGLTLDGVLVERMARPGLELILGAKRDPAWGPVLVLGLGGIWAEALQDFRLLPADFDAAGILAELRRLKGASLLDGLRGAAPVDVGAAVRAAMILGAILRATPDLREIEINPLVLHPAGEGATALDALLIATP